MKKKSLFKRLSSAAMASSAQLVGINAGHNSLSVLRHKPSHSAVAVNMEL
ncbi:MAG: hypothetical protein ACLVIP_14170 [Ruminococcus sp.]